jgi:hypothetical protein
MDDPTVITIAGSPDMLIFHEAYNLVQTLQAAQR